MTLPRRGHILRSQGAIGNSARDDFVVRIRPKMVAGFLLRDPGIQKLVDDPRAVPGAGADHRNRVTAGLAGLRVAATEPADVADRCRRRGIGRDRIDFGCLAFVLAGSERDQNQDECQPKGRSQ